MGGLWHLTKLLVKVKRNAPRLSFPSLKTSLLINQDRLRTGVQENSNEKRATAFSSSGAQEFAPNVRANYTGKTLGKLVAGHPSSPAAEAAEAAAGAATGAAGLWEELRATVVVPSVSAGVAVGHNGTALQLRLTAPQSERGWGATVWLDKASIVDASARANANVAAAEV